MDIDNRGRMMLRERWCNRKRGKCTLQHFKVRYQTKNIIPPPQLPKKSSETSSSISHDILTNNNNTRDSTAIYGLEITQWKMEICQTTNALMQFQNMDKITNIARIIHCTMGKLQWGNGNRIFRGKQPSQIFDKYK